MLRGPPVFNLASAEAGVEPALSLECWYKLNPSQMDTGDRGWGLGAGGLQEGEARHAQPLALEMRLEQRNAQIKAWYAVE